jgi:pilus assembly protein Flp/PilA
VKKPSVVCGRLLREQEGVSTLEYALLGALIAVTCVATLSILSGNVKALYTTICNSVSIAISGAPAC